MADLAAAQNLVGWCQQAGFTGSALTTFVCLGLCESGGNPNAVNQNNATMDDSWGLFQINYYGSLAASRTAMFGPKEGLLDPVKNAQAAYSLSNGGANTSPWQSDYNNGAYYKNLPTAQEAVAAGGTTSPYSGTVSGNTTPGSSNATLTAYTGDYGHQPVIQFSTGWLGNIPGVPGTISLINEGQAHEILGVALMIAGAITAVVALAVLGKRIGSIRSGTNGEPGVQEQSFLVPQTGPRMPQQTSAPAQESAPKAPMAPPMASVSADQILDWIYS